MIETRTPNSILDKATTGFQQSEKSWNGLSLANPRMWLLGVLGVTALGLVLRLGNIGYSFNGDDIIVLRAMQGDLASVYQWVIHAQYNPLYYLLLKSWLYLFSGVSEVSLRTLSVVFGVLSIPLVFAVGRRLFSPQVGFVVGLMLAVSPFHIEQASQPKPNTFLVVLTLVALLLFHRWLSNDRPEEIIGFVFVSILGLYTHYFFVFILLALDVYGFILLLRARDGQRLWKLFLSQLCIAIAWVPWFPVILGTIEKGEMVAPRVSLLWGPLEVVATFSLGYSGFTFTGTSTDKAFSLSDIPPNIPVILISAIAFGLLILFALSRLRRDPSTVFAANLLLLPAVVSYLLALVSPSFGAWTAKSLIGCSLGYYLLLAAAIARGKYRRLSMVLVIVVFALMSYSLYNYYLRDNVFGRKLNWRGAVEYVVSHSQADDIIGLADDMTFRWYYKGNLELAGFFYMPVGASAEAELSRAERTFSGHPRVWFLEVTRASMDPSTPQIIAVKWLRANYGDEMAIRLNPTLVLHLFATPMPET